MHDYRRYVADIDSVFLTHLGTAPLLTEINSATVSLFQRERKKLGVSNGYTNKEVGALRTIMKWAGLWSDQVKRYRCLPPDPPRDEYIPTSADLEKLIAAGITRTKWEVALWSSVLSANSGLGPQEIKLIKLKDIHLGKDPLGSDAGYITVARRCKTIFRYRNQPMNANAFIAVNRLLERLKRLGYGDRFEHYLLPQRLKTASKGEKYDPMQPQGDWHTIGFLDCRT
jgi:hypothetical protein